mgnify:CR=1 FL=1
MSYCVNCGVELADSEKRCPLCHVEVQNPKAPWEEPPERPYSHHVNTIMKRIDRGYLATLVGLLLFIPCVVTVLLDILSGNGLTWSAYVIGAVGLVYVSVLMPFYFKKYHTLAFLSADFGAVALYLFLIERMSGGHWFLGLGLPLTAAAGVCTIGLVFLFARGFSMILMKIGVIMITIGLFLVCVETLTSLYVHGAVRFAWSLYALIPCASLGAATLILERRKSLKESIRRRLFY